MRVFNADQITQIKELSLPVLKEKYDISEGCLYPRLMHLRDSNAFKEVSIAVGFGWLEAFGPGDQLNKLAKSIIDLCSADVVENGIVYPRTAADALIQGTKLNASPRSVLMTSTLTP